MEDVVIDVGDRRRGVPGWPVAVHRALSSGTRPADGLPAEVFFDDIALTAVPEPTTTASSIIVLPVVLSGGTFDSGSSAVAAFLLGLVPFQRFPRHDSVNLNIRFLDCLRLILDRFVYVAPTLILDVPVEFEFAKIPLPGP